MEDFVEDVLVEVMVVMVVVMVVVIGGEIVMVQVVDKDYLMEVDWWRWWRNFFDE